jgi:ATP-binding cassette subfamily F protein uup
LVVSHDRDFLDRVATQIVAAEGDGKFAVYAGGYSDMMAQRGQGTAQKASSASAKKAPREAKPPRAGAPKLNFSDVHALKTLPGEIEALNRRIVTLQADLSDPNLYARDAKKFAALSAGLTETMTKRDGAEELWLALEMKREEIEG